MTRLIPCLRVLGATIVDLSLCACGTNDHPTTPAPQKDAGTQRTEDAAAEDGGDAGMPDDGADGFAPLAVASVIPSEDPRPKL
jgi:hypothetical protein